MTVTTELLYAHMHGVHIHSLSDVTAFKNVSLSCFCNETKRLCQSCCTHAGRLRKIYLIPSATVSPPTVLAIPLTTGVVVARNNDKDKEKRQQPQPPATLAGADGICTYARAPTHKLVLRERESQVLFRVNQENVEINKRRE